MTVDDTENDAQGDVQKCTICTLSSAIPNFATSIVVTGMSKVTIEAVGNAEISICGTTEEDPAFGILFIYLCKFLISFLHYIWKTFLNYSTKQGVSLLITNYL